MAAIAVAVCVAAIASWHADQGDDAADGLRPTKSTASKTKVAALNSAAPVNRFDERIEQLKAREHSDVDIVNIFEPITRKPAPPPPPPPPTPVAPAFPYSILGSMTEDSVPTLFLATGNRVIVARPQQVIDGVYQVDNVDASGLTVTYLPLHQKQTIALGPSR